MLDVPSPKQVRPAATYDVGSKVDRTYFPADALVNNGPAQPEAPALHLHAPTEKVAGPRPRLARTSVFFGPKGWVVHRWPSSDGLTYHHASRVASHVASGSKHIDRKRRPPVCLRGPLFISTPSQEGSDQGVVHPDEGQQVPPWEQREARPLVRLRPGASAQYAGSRATRGPVEVLHQAHDEGGRTRPSAWFICRSASEALSPAMALMVLAGERSGSSSACPALARIDLT